MMTFKDYQEQAFSTADYPEYGTGSFLAINYLILGLGGEGGECVEKWKKLLRNNYSEALIKDFKNTITEEMKRKIISEVGDSLWYIAVLAKELGFTMDEIAQMNLDKLKDRQERGVIKSEGDDR